MGKKHLQRPKTIIILFKIIVVIALLLLPLKTLAVEFDIKVDPDVAANTDFDVQKIIKYAHERVAPDFEYTKDHKITVIVYSRIKFKEALGNSPNWIEAAYDGKIRLAIATNQKDFRMITSQVVHEYTHLIIGDITQNNCPRWFNEGLAKYEEYKHGMEPRLFLLAIAYNSNILIPWDKINTQITSLNGSESLLAYQQSFSFVSYLIETYGMHKVVELLKALGAKQDFNAAVLQVYGVPIETIQSNWRIWLTGFMANWAQAPLIVE
jgi:hypothetical protein